MATEEERLVEIRNLLILLLQKMGASSGEIGEVLNKDSSTIRRLSPPSAVSDAEVQAEVSGDG